MSHRFLILFLLLALALVSRQAAFALNEAGGSGNPLLAESPFTYWKSNDGPPKLVILSVHGFGLHKMAFAGFAKKMQECGIATYAMDIRGFGDWVSSHDASKNLEFDTTLVDMGSTLLWLHKMHPHTPVILLGESLGGAFVIQAAALYPQFVDGVIASVPSSDFFKQKKTIINGLLHATRPNQQFDISKEVVDQATSNKALEKSWKQDPRSKLAISAKELFEFDRFIKKTHELAPSITDKPVLLLHGAQDKLAKPDGTLRLYSELSTKEKNMVMVGNAEHLIFEETQLDEHTIDLVKNWLQNHFSKDLVGKKIQAKACIRKPSFKCG